MYVNLLSSCKDSGASDDNTTNWKEIPKIPQVKNHEVVAKRSTDFVVGQGLNTIDSLGHKTGLWCNVSPDYITYEYFEHGKHNGSILSFDNSKGPNRNLLLIGSYHNDMPDGQWIYFYENGRIQFILSKITKNKDFTEEAKRLGYYNVDKMMQCYTECFDSLGNKTEEGWTIFFESFEIEESRVGKWKKCKSGD